MERSRHHSIRPLPALVALITALLAGLLPAASALATPAPNNEASVRRTVAVTVDDLPAISTQRDLATHTEITNNLVTGFQRHSIPAIGFVNEVKLTYDEDGNTSENATIQAQRVALLERWLDAGLELGNHSYSHPSLFRTPLDEFQADVVRGEQTTRRLLKDRNRDLVYFRHPFLNTGPDLETKAAFEAFLAKHNYTIAPVTIDNTEWIFARAYDNALDRKDQALSKRVVDAYLAYMDTMFAYYEQQSEALLGYELQQILLIHANRLNADHLDSLVEMIRKRGYTFVSLSEALKDKAYAHPDRYAGRSGITWLHRWAITEGKPGQFFGSEPETPTFVNETANIQP